MQKISNINVKFKEEKAEFILNQPISINSLTEEKINSELMKGYSDYRNCKLKPAKQVFNEM